MAASSDQMFQHVNHLKNLAENLQSLLTAYMAIVNFNMGNYGPVRSIGINAALLLGHSEL